jgi:hypothetical protein
MSSGVVLLFVSQLNLEMIRNIEALKNHPMYNAHWKEVDLLVTKNNLTSIKKKNSSVYVL